MEQHTAHDASVLSLGEDWFDPLEAGVRQRIRSFIEEMLEAELEAALQRRRYERAFAGNHPHAIWLADITSVVTDEGWLYLAAGEIVG